MKSLLFAALLGATGLATSPGSAQNATVSAPLQSPIPDVRGLEFREVTLLKAVGISSVYIQGARLPAPPSVHLWVLLAKDGETARGIGWNGVEYELKSVGPPADWRADVQTQLKPHLSEDRYYLPRPFDFSESPLSRLFLAQLGAPELGKTSSTRSSPARLRGEAINPGVEYLYNLRGEGLNFFTQGDFGQAKRQLQTLLAVAPAELPQNVYNPRAEATRILADIARRETNPPRPTDEIAGLIWDLQNVRSINSWTIDPALAKLIDAGDRAVEPLLDALESDDRLTLGLHVSNFRLQNFAPIDTVRDAAQSALQTLLHHLYYSKSYRLSSQDQQRDIARQMRADWQKVKGDSPVERIFKVLARPNQTPERLEEAARELVRLGKPYSSNIIYVEKKNGVYVPITEPKNFFGEPLRAHRDPSISDLLEARILELSNRALNAKFSASALDPTQPDNINDPDPFSFNHAIRAANQIAVCYSKWEPKRAALLLGAQLERTKRYVSQVPRGLAADARRSLEGARQQFLVARLNSPQRAEALREYGEFLQKQPFGRVAKENYVALWRFPHEPAIERAAHALLHPPLQPFQGIAQWKTSDFDPDSAFRLLQSPLIRLPQFKAAVQRELSNKTVIGTLRLTKKKEADLKVSAWDWSAQGIYLPASPSSRKLENGRTQPMRVCDLVGFWLMENRPDPRGQNRSYPLLDVWLPTAERDARLKQIEKLLMQGKVVADEFDFSSF